MPYLVPLPFPATLRPPPRPAALGLALLGLALAGSACTPPADDSGGGGAAGGGIAAEAPALTLPRADDGQPLDLRAAGDGRVVLVDLWATWCVPCVAELPHLQSLSETFPNDDFLMLGIVLESGNAEDVAEFVAERGLTYPNVMGSDEARDAFGPFLGYPTKYLVDRDGKILKRYFGPVGEVLDEEIGALIETGALD